MAGISMVTGADKRKRFGSEGRTQLCLMPKAATLLGKFMDQGRRPLSLRDAAVQPTRQKPYLSRDQSTPEASSDGGRKPAHAAVGVNSMKSGRAFRACVV
jgi:hypothetical protein